MERKQIMECQYRFDNTENYSGTNFRHLFRVKMSIGRYCVELVFQSCIIDFKFVSDPRAIDWKNGDRSQN